MRQATLESKEHDVVMAWASWNGLYIIHARCRRRVHDLPPGWPDFNLIYGNKIPLVEMKVHTKPLAACVFFCTFIIVHMILLGAAEEPVVLGERTEGELRD